MQLPESTGDFAPAPEGTFPARCYRIVDLGTQQTDYKGETKLKHQITVTWELATELVEDGRAFSLMRWYTLSGHPKASLRKDLESWRGKAFEDSDFGENGSFKLQSVLGVPCLLNVVHKVTEDGARAQIAGVVGVPKGMVVPPAINPTVFFSLEPGEFDPVIFEALPDFAKATIQKSPEYFEVTSPAAPPLTVDPLSDSLGGDEIPF